MYIFNGDTTIKYFLLGRGARQDEQFQRLLFILPLETIFLLLKSAPEIKGLKLFDYFYLYSAYADDTTFFKMYFL